jgi:hypothetical protein
MALFDVTQIDMIGEISACAVTDQWGLAEILADSIGSTCIWIRVQPYGGEEILLDIFPVAAATDSEAYKLGLICGLNRDSGSSLKAVSSRLSLVEMAAFERGFYQAHLIIN